MPNRLPEPTQHQVRQAALLGEEGAHGGDSIMEMERVASSLENAFRTWGVIGHGVACGFPTAHAGAQGRM